MRSRADLAVVKDKTTSLPFFKEVAGRSSLVKTAGDLLLPQKEKQGDSMYAEYPTGGRKNPPSSTAAPGTNTDRYLK